MNGRGDALHRRPISCPDRDTQTLLREAERQGFEVRKLGSGHYAVRKDGRLLLTVSGTNISSGVRRRNRHVLEQAGFQ